MQLVCQVSLVLNFVGIAVALLALGILVKHWPLIRGVAGFAKQMGRLSEVGGGPPLADQMARRRPARVSMRPPIEDD